MNARDKELKRLIKQQKADMRAEEQGRMPSSMNDRNCTNNTQWSIDGATVKFNGKSGDSSEVED